MQVVPTIAPLPESEALALAGEVVARCRVLAAMTDVPGETTRTFLSDGMRRANAQVAAWMREAGMAVHTDAAGNLHGVLPGVGAPLLVASHLDTVPNAGAFDGVLGVVIGVALAARCGASLPFPLRVVAFSEEEGVRFGVPFVGSRALVGTADDVLLGRTDRDGVTVREAIAGYGLPLDELDDARVGVALGYIEFHIEQGPVLEQEGLPLGVVTAIAGQMHAAVRFRGTANHAGTTPMHLRHDALAAAAEWVSVVEGLAKTTDGAVATVGQIAAVPGARNVIAGEVRCSLDVRMASDSQREWVGDAMLLQAHQIGERRGVEVTTEVLLRQSAVPMSGGVTALLAEAVTAEGLPVRRMVSGAGHDAMIVAPHLPAAMLFLRTPGGLSHHPDESVAVDDVAAALRVGVRFLQMLAARTEKV